MLAAGAGRVQQTLRKEMYDQEQAMKFEMGREELRMKYLDREMSAQKRGGNGARQGKIRIGNDQGKK